jgi:hypothetical protein
VTDLNLPIPGELIERIAESIAERAFDVFADRLANGTPWMTTCRVAPRRSGARREAAVAHTVGVARPGALSILQRLGGASVAARSPARARSVL